MKYAKILAILLLGSVITFYGCNENTKEQEKQQEPPQPLIFSDTPASSTDGSSTPATIEPAQNTAGVFHYTCSKGCPGGGASAGNCPTCGAVLAHNQAYHANTNNATPTSPLLTPPAAQSSGQNTAGVFHYTCPKGCAGGGSSAGNCSTCGETLAHNAAYHQ